MVSGSVRRLVKAAASSCAQGQRALSRRVVRRPLRTSKSQTRLAWKLEQGKLARPTLLGLLDPVFHPGVEPVAGLQVGGVEILGIGDQGLVAQAVGVEEVVAGTGLGLLPAHQHSGAPGPGREIEPGGDLGHLGALPLLHLLGEILRLASDDLHHLFRVGVALAAVLSLPTCSVLVLLSW